MTIAMDRDTVQDAFHHAVLVALDLVAAEIFKDVPGAKRRAPGASDADLPQLFRCIDAQLDRLCERYNVVLAVKP